MTGNVLRSLESNARKRATLAVKMDALRKEMDALVHESVEETGNTVADTARAASISRETAYKALLRASQNGGGAHG